MKPIPWDVVAKPYCPSTKPEGVVNLAISENLLMQHQLIQHLKDDFNPPTDALRYGEGPHGSKKLRAALARVINQHFSPYNPVSPESVSASNGVSSSIERLAFALGNPKDCFVLGRPYYSHFPLELGQRAEVNIIPVSFGDTDPFSLDAVHAYDAAITEAKTQNKTVRAILLCSPHNPLGRCYPVATLMAIMRLCQAHHIHLVVDEVYAFSIYSNSCYNEAEGFSSILAINTTNIIDPALVHMTWGLSKDFGAGLRIGCVISQANPKLIDALGSNVPHSYPASFLDYIAQHVLHNQKFVEHYLAENRRRLTESYNFTAALLAEYMVPFQRKTNAGLFVLVDLGTVYLRRTVATRGSEKTRLDLTTEITHLLLAQGVYLASGDDFGCEQPGLFRIVFSQPQEVIREGVRRIASALNLKRKE